MTLPLFFGTELSGLRQSGGDQNSVSQDTIHQRIVSRTFKKHCGKKMVGE
jgi:hypothetical protein